MKKLISTLLAVVIIALASPLCYAAVYESYSYEVNSDNTITITSFNSFHISDLTVPDSIDGKSVTAIGDNAFYMCESLTSITLPAADATIGAAAFRKCSAAANPGTLDLPMH